MRNFKVGLAWAFVVLFAAICVSPVCGQIELFLQFESTNGNGGQFNAPYTWRAPVFFVDGVTVVSPGGTEVSTSDFFGLAEFDNFVDFQNDVVGTWTVFFIDETVQMEFDIASFNIDVFASIEIASPQEGDQFFSGEVIQVSVAPTIDPEIVSGTSVASGGANIEFLGNNGLDTNLSATLNRGVEIATIGVARIARMQTSELVTNLQGDTEFFDLMPSCVESTSQRVNLEIVVQLGDVNQDGTVDLLDIAPFVELIASSTFQLEADTNQDGVVDLLDVAPFIQIFS